MIEITIRELKIGEWFTLKPIEEPKESQVYIRGWYEPSVKKYVCGRFDDVGFSREFKGDRLVYTDFFF